MGEKILSYNLDGVKVDESSIRYYPNNELFSKVIGFAGSDGQGVVGLETVYDKLLAIFIVVLAISRYVSLGSIIAAACCPVITFLFQYLQRDGLPMWYLWLNTGLAALMAAWVIWMHRTNIQRLKAGNENKFSFHKSSHS